MKNDLSFESSMAELNDIVEKLQSGAYSLDESLAAFEKAVKLIAFCNKTLEDAKQKVRVLTENSDGTVSDSDFVPDDET